MRNMLIILLLFLLWSCTSCNGNDSSTDDKDLLIDKDAVFEDKDLDEISDFDLDSDNVDDENSEDNESELPDLSNDPYVKNYPDYDKNIAYEYYGDFDVIAKDPDEVRKLWEKNAGVTAMLECEKMPFDLCSENYPFEPQIIDGPYEPYSKEYYDNLPQITNKCDALLTPGHWETSNLFNEKIFHGKGNLFSYYMASHTGSWQSGGIYIYDIIKRQITRISRGLASFGFNKNSLFIADYDWKINITEPESQYYGQSFKYPIYYNYTEHKYGHMWKMKDNISKPIDNLVDLRASDTYVLMTAYFDSQGSDARIMYTKIGEWDKWKELTYKKDTLYGLDRRAGYGSMLGQYIVYFDYDLEIQFCDLEKGDAGCFRVSRAGEESRYPYILNDKNIVYYFSTDSIDTKKVSIIKADITDKNSIKYSVVLERNSVTGAWINQIDDKFIIFTERRFSNGKEGKALQCYYRFSDKKVFCMDGEFDLGLEKVHTYTYKRMSIYTAEQMIAVRDMECYCDYNPDKCPFDDYTPNTASPKDPWRRPFHK